MGNNVKYMNMQSIYNKYKNGGYSINRGEYATDRVADGHIFDEDKSVRWNREQVELHNKHAEAEWSRMNSDIQAKNNELHTDVIHYIMAEYGMNYKQAEALESYAYADKHSCMHDYFLYIDEFAGKVQMIMSLK